MNIAIIGNGTAGITVASEIRKNNNEAIITIIDKSDKLPYSRCSLPYLISGAIKDSIQTFGESFYKSNNLNLVQSKVNSINATTKKVKTDDQELEYDKLVIATGAAPFIPSIKGLEDYYTLHSIEDAEKITKAADTAKNAVIIGAGMVGVEIADSLSKKQINVTLIEVQENILNAILDKDMSNIIEKRLKGELKLFTKANIKEISQNKIILENQKIEFDLLIMSCGVKPNLFLAKSASLDVDKGIIVNNKLQTSNPDIYACGDCIELPGVAKLATNAIVQAKVIANNIIGNNQNVPTMHNTCITKIHNLIVGSTGQLECDSTISAVFHGKTRAEYYPESKKIHVKLIAKDNKLVGAQIIGEEDVIGRINWLALAIQNNMTVEQLCKAEAAYNPALSSTFDPVIVAANILQRKISK